MSGSAEMMLGGIQVATTSGRGFTPEEIAERAVNKIVTVGKDSHPLVAQQAEAFKADIHKVIVYYMHQAIKSHNVTLANKFKQAGHPEAVKLLEL